MQSTRQATREAASGHETIHRFHVESADAGTLGFVDGGKLLEWIDEAAHATAAQWCGRCCVTASVGNFHLDRPIRVGQLVEVQASLVHTGCCSMHILVTICSLDLSQTHAVQTSQCSIVFVAVDERGRPVEVPRWTPVTMLELQRQRQARVRIRMRRRNPRRTWPHGRGHARRARLGQNCPAVAARRRRRPSTRSARPAPDRATATARTLHHCNRIPRSGLTETGWTTRPSCCIDES
jgi:acyl-CoA hydrolase